MKKQGTVYVLRLENDKWYVGWTTDLTRRLKTHSSGKSGAKNQWLRDNPMIECVYTAPGTTSEENIIAVDMAILYGIQNVRGGYYVNPRRRIL